MPQVDPHDQQNRQRDDAGAAARRTASHQTVVQAARGHERQGVVDRVDRGQTARRP